MRAILFITLALTAAVAAAPSNQERIIGGTLTNINKYPQVVSLLYSWNSVTFWQTCTGTIINNRAILTVAHCPAGDVVGRWRVRVGSTFANSGGLILVVATILIPAAYNARTFDNDIGILRTTTNMGLNVNVMPATLADETYSLPDNQLVQTVGWGFTSAGGVLSEQLRYVDIRSLNHDLCKERYHNFGEVITDNMLCSSWLEDGNKGQCRGDDGSPLYHNSVVVGIYSWGGCAQPYYPTVNVRVSRYTVWIHANA